MKLQLKNFNFSIDLDEKINTIIIENKIEYRKIVNSFVNELNIRDGNILLSKDIELLVPDKYIFTFYDYFTFDINKYALTKLYKKLKLITKKDMILISLLEPYLLILFSSICKNNFLPSLKNQTKIDLLNLKLQYLRTYLNNLHEAKNPL